MQVHSFIDETLLALKKKHCDVKVLEISFKLCFHFSGSRDESVNS